MTEEGFLTKSLQGQSGWLFEVRRVSLAEVSDPIVEALNCLTCFYFEGIGTFFVFLSIGVSLFP